MRPQLSGNVKWQLCEVASLWNEAESVEVCRVLEINFTCIIITKADLIFIGQGK